MNEIREKYLKDLYKLGIIQGEHNINWSDGYGLLEFSKNYYNDVKIIADEYNIKYNDCLEDFDEGDDEEYAWDRLGSHILENLKEHIINLLI